MLRRAHNRKITTVVPAAFGNFTHFLRPTARAAKGRLMNNASAPTLSPSTTEIEVINKALAQAPRPLTVKQLRDLLTGPFKLEEERLTALLDAQVDAGRVYRFAATGPGKLPRYWTRKPEELAQQTMLRVLAQRPHTRAEVLYRAKASLAGFSKEEQQQLLTALVRAGQVYELPFVVGGRAKLYSALPADARDYLEDAITKISKKLAVPRNEVLRAVRALAEAEEPAATATPTTLPSDPNEAVLARMVQVKLAAAQGGLVPLNELWHSLKDEGWDKASFDRTVLSLAESYRVALQRHNFPASLKEEERAELVTDELGNHYIGIALRTNGT